MLRVQYSVLVVCATPVGVINTWPIKCTSMCSTLSSLSAMKSKWSAHVWGAGKVSWKRQDYANLAICFGWCRCETVSLKRLTKLHKQFTSGAYNILELNNFTLTLSWRDISIICISSIQIQRWKGFSVLLLAFYYKFHKFIIPFGFSPEKLIYIPLSREFDSLLMGAKLALALCSAPPFKRTFIPTTLQLKFWIGAV